MKKGRKKVVLIVDDEERNRKLLVEYCRSLGFKTFTAENGIEALGIAGHEAIDLILMDVMMPVMDGFEATERLKSDSKTRHIPVIMVTALDSREDRLKGISAGADDLLTKPIDLEELSLKMRNNLKLKEYHDFLRNHNILLEEQVEKRTRQLKDTLKNLEISHKKIRFGYLETVYRMTLASEYKDEETGAHIKRTSFYTKELAKALGMSKEFVDHIFYASPMHDIGKVGIPDSILLKPGKLTSREWETMKTHTSIGKKILGGSQSPFLKMAEEIAMSHHERWDGSGYPEGLKGDEIPLSSRIMNIVDQYDALRSQRPYKPAFEHERVVEIITRGDGRTLPAHFDPQILDAFRSLTEKFREIYEAYRD